MFVSDEVVLKNRDRGCVLAEALVLLSVFSMVLLEAATSSWMNAVVFRADRML